MQKLGWVGILLKVVDNNSEKKVRKVKRNIIYCIFTSVVLCVGICLLAIFLENLIPSMKSYFILIQVVFFIISVCLGILSVMIVIFRKDEEG